MATGKTVITSDHALKLEFIPEWIAIVGSGYIGLEFSDVYTALGSEVVPFLIIYYYAVCHKNNSLPRNYVLYRLRLVLRSPIPHYKSRNLFETIFYLKFMTSYICNQEPAQIPAVNLFSLPLLSFNDN